MKAFLRPHRFRHPYPVRFYTTKTQSGHSRRRKFKFMVLKPTAGRPHDAPRTEP